MEIIVLGIMILALIVLMGVITAGYLLLMEQVKDKPESKCSHLYTEKEYVGYFFVFERFQVRCKQCKEIIHEYLE